MMKRGSQYVHEPDMTGPSPAVSVYPDVARPEIAAFVPSSVRRLLDVGCSRGAFGSLMNKRGIEVWGVEPNPQAAAEAEGRIEHVIIGRYPEDLPAGQTFDCITFNDVLEHMEDPSASLEAARSHLACDGKVLASIPNIRHLSILRDLGLRGRWDYVDVGILDRTHLRFFTRVTMRELFESAGYRVDVQVPINIS